MTVSTVGPETSQATSTISSDEPAVAMSGGRDAGTGHSSSISRASRSTPTPLWAEQQSTGNTAPAATPPARDFSSSA